MINLISSDGSVLITKLALCDYDLKVSPDFSVPSIAVHQEDTLTIDMSGDGTLANKLRGDVRLSANPDNILTIDPLGGLLALTVSPLSVLDTTTVDLTLASNVLSAAVKLKAGSNALIDSTGLYVPILTSNNGITKTGDNFQLGGDLVQNTDLGQNFNFTISAGRFGVNTTPLVPIAAAAGSAYLAAIKGVITRDWSNASLESLTAIAGNNTMTNATVQNHSAGNPNSGVLGQLITTITQTASMVLGNPYAGVLGFLRGNASANITQGIISGLACGGAFSGTGQYANVAGIHITAMKPTGPGFTGSGRIVNNYSIYIESTDSSMLGSTPPTLYGIYQVGTVEPNIFNSVIEAGTNNLYWKVPVGSNADRATITSPATGMIRYNTNSNKYEGYIAGSINGWRPLDAQV